MTGGPAAVRETGPAEPETGPSVPCLLRGGTPGILVRP